MSAKPKAHHPPPTNTITGNIRHKIDVCYKIRSKYCIPNSNSYSLSTIFRLAGGGLPAPLESSTCLMTQGFKKRSAPPLAPLETACEDQTSTFFHLLIFLVTPSTLGNATSDLEKLAQESLSSYVRNHCAEGVLIQAFHTNTSRLEESRSQFVCPGKAGTENLSKII